MKRLCGVLLSLAAVTARCGADKEAKPAADAAAEKLLADARAARAVWKDFPGFTADVEVNVEGKVARGRVVVGPKGDVTLKLPDDEHERWARRALASVVGHRLDDGGARRPASSRTTTPTTRWAGRCACWTTRSIPATASATAR